MDSVFLSAFQISQISVKRYCSYSVFLSHSFIWTKLAITVTNTKAHVCVPVPWLRMEEASPGHPPRGAPGAVRPRFLRIHTRSSYNFTPFGTSTWKTTSGAVVESVPNAPFVTNSSLWDYFVSCGKAIVGHVL